MHLKYKKNPPPKKIKCKSGNNIVFTFVIVIRDVRENADVSSFTVHGLEHLKAAVRSHNHSLCEENNSDVKHNYFLLQLCQ